MAPEEIMTMTNCTQARHISKEPKCIPEILKNKFWAKICAKNIQWTKWKLSYKIYKWKKQRKELTAKR